MKKEVDARGLSCPMPLIQTKKALEAMEKGSVVTTVDNATAKENISKFAKSMHYPCHVMENPGEFVIEIQKGQEETEAVSVPESQPETLQAPVDLPSSDLVIMVSKDTMGSGSEELGRILMKGYLYALTEVDPLPNTLIFVNGGVRLTCQGSESLEDLRRLEERGVEILSCGTCLDYFKLKSDLAVGGVSNMYTIVEHLNGVGNTYQI